jgi:hypothetical protein
MNAHGRHDAQEGRRAGEVPPGSPPERSQPVPQPSLPGTQGWMAVLLGHLAGLLPGVAGVRSAGIPTWTRESDAESGPGI